MQIKEQLRSAITAHFPFEMSQEQLLLSSELCNFFVSENDLELFVLNGYAGTGKTTLLSAFVNALKTVKEKSVLLAPTGRAAKVFSNRSGQPAHTIHKKIYRKETVPGGGVRLVVPPNLHTNTIFFIDEASMIGDYSLRNDGSVSPRNLLEDVINYVYSGKNCKIIFIGDVAQLPPVGSDFSPALNLAYLQQNYGRLTVLGFQLKNVLRQAEGSDILINATQLRTAPENAFPKFSISSNKDLIRLPGDELQDALDSAFATYGRDETIIITRSNKRANLYNQQVRSRILWYEEDICGGDLVMVVRNNYFWLDDKSQAGFIANGEIMEIERISGREEIYGFQFADARVRLIDYPKMGSIEVKIMLDVIYEDTPNLSREKMKALFFAIEHDYAHERNKKKRYERIMADPYFNALQIKFAYAVTCHKSQGGQWACVFLDQGFLTEELLDHNFFRWLYTAFTRSTQKLYLINFDKAFFE